MTSESAKTMEYLLCFITDIKCCFVRQKVGQKVTKSGKIRAGIVQYGRTPLDLNDSRNNSINNYVQLVQDKGDKSYFIQNLTTNTILTSHLSN